MVWQGVFPAATTQFRADESLDIAATQLVYDNLIRDGVHGLIVLGTVGENYALSADEKRQVMTAAREVANGRVPILSGCAETTTAEAARYARDAEKIGIDGLMVLPGLIYVSQPHETIAHYRQVAAVSGLPIMVYNNPVSYKVDITVEMFAELADVKNLVAIKESTEDTRRLVDLANAGLDQRYALFCGVDDIVLESLMLGAVGWVSGLTSAFPKESVALFKLAKAGRYEEALAIYKWFMPLLHLDTIPTLVQCIKLAEQVMGRGGEMVRAPRLRLAGAERERVIKLVETAAATRPLLPS